MLRPQSEAVDAVGKAKGEGMVTLGSQRTSRRTGRKLALDHREDGFHEGTLREDGLGKLSLHRSADPCRALGPLAALCKDNVLCSADVADMGMVEFAVEFGVSQNPWVDTRFLGSRQSQDIKAKRS